MFTQAYKAALNTILRKPFMLWGLSLLSVIICAIATVTAGMLGFIGTAFGYVISVGMAKVYLDGLEGKQVNSDQLFSGFNNRVFRIAGGMAWKQIWSIIWAIAIVAIPLAIALIFGILATIPFIGKIFMVLGIIAAVVSVIPACILYVSKIYSYSFVPYILATRPDVTATQALRLSMELTNGKKLQMWLADFLYGVIVFFVSLILMALSAIPFIGFIFALVLVAWFVVILLFGSLFKGLYAAEFYRIKPTPKAPKASPFNGGFNPQQGFNAPQQGYAPQQNYAPQQGYAAPQQQNYNAPQQNFNQNNQ